MERVLGHLASLRPGMLVHLGDEQLMVERTLHFDQGTERWVEHRLSDDRLGRSLWLEIREEAGALLTVYERLPVREDPPDAPEITRDGITYTLSERGRAEYRSQERAGPGKQGRVEFVEYAAGRVRLAFECFDGATWEASLGHLLEPGDVRVAQP